LSFAVRSKKPTLIACRTIIGLGAPTKAGTAGSHGAPLGPKEAEAAKQFLGWHEPLFTVPEDSASGGGSPVRAVQSKAGMAENA